MFTWICPKCGAEVPPAYNECPRCTANAAAAGQTAPPPAPGLPPPPPAAPPPVAQPAYPAPAAPPAAYPPQAYAPQPAYPPPPAYPPSPYAAQAYPPARHQAPAWMVSLLTVAGMAAVLGLIYYFVSGRKPSADPVRTTAAAAETPQAAAEPKAAAGSSDLTKNLEFTGIRVKEDKQQRVEVHFIAVNHSLAELPAMKLEVKLKTAGRKDALAEFTADLPSMGPFETREIATTAKTKMRAYELPDWQFLQAEVDAKEPERLS